MRYFALLLQLTFRLTLITAFFFIAIIPVVYEITVLNVLVYMPFLLIALLLLSLITEQGLLKLTTRLDRKDRVNGRFFFHNRCILCSLH